jgi:hypothetical protein
MWLGGGKRKERLTSTDVLPIWREGTRGDLGSGSSTSQMLRDERDRKQSDLSTGCPGRERKKRKRGKDGDGPDGAVVWGGDEFGTVLGVPASRGQLSDMASAWNKLSRWRANRVSFLAIGRGL